MLLIMCLMLVIVLACDAYVCTIRIPAASFSAPSLLLLRSSSPFVLPLLSLYFIAYTDKDDNELLTLEVIHHYVEILDRYFGNVCELDIIFNFHKAYYLLDETLIAGELQETSKQKVLHATVAQDMLIKAANGQDS